MLRTYVFSGFASLTLFLTAVVIGCGRTPTEATPAAQDQHADTTVAGTSHASDESHGHVAGAHGGTIVSLGSDSYHVEAIINDDGEIRLYTLGNDETRVIDVEAQTLAGYVKAEGSAESLEIQLEPHPQPGDKEGRTSLFVGKAPEPLVGKSLEVTVPNITIEGERFRLHFNAGTKAHGAEHGEAMPDKVGTAEERSLYLTPGGIYTEEDIAANGSTVA